jgi:2-polyprenyl-6-methoxyphenol hydroxylase-like FAD-dependent oxidoreductase
MSGRRVLVVGGGPAGTSLAVCLQRQGFTTEIAEIQPDWGVLGIGILLLGPALRAVEPLGIVDRIFEAGCGYSQLIAHTGNGQQLRVVDIPRLLGPDRPAVCGIMRPQLRAIFADAVRAAGVTVRLGVTVATLDQSGDAVSVELSDGGLGTYDLVVGADGAYSQVRSLVFEGAARPEFQGQYVWRAVVERDPAVQCIELYYGEGRTAGLNPVSPTEMYAFFVQNSDERLRIPDEQLPEVMRRELAGFGGRIATARDGIRDPSRIIMRPIEAHLLAAPWHRGRAVLIGDAVHSMPPHLSSGAMLALEDAVVLAECLGEGDAIEESLERFTSARYDRCRTIVADSIQIGAWQREGGPDKAPLIAAMLGKSWTA